MTRSPALPLPPPNERRRLREACALTRAHLAKRLGVRPDTVRSWESGRSTPRGRNRVAYAELLSALAAETAEAEGLTPHQAPQEPQEPQTPHVLTIRTAPAEGAEGSRGDAPSNPTTYIVTPTSADGPESPEGDPARADEPAPTDGPDVAGGPESGCDPVSESGPAPEGGAESRGPRASRPAAPRRRRRRRPSWARALRPAGERRPVPAVSRDVGPYVTPAQAFDALYAYCAPALVRQAYLLTGRRDLAHESVERAFQRAWDHWPEVARDPDPPGWVRAATHDWALSPWHRFRRRHRHPEPPPPEEDDRALLDALLSLPPPYRRTLVLYDGVGLDLPETAAETEASTRAAAGRLMHAREILAEALPELADPAELHARLAELASTGRTRAQEPAAVRGGSERRARLWTRTAAAVTVVLIGSTAMTLRTAPTHYVPPVPPGETVRGVPPRVAPGPLSDDERELRDRLREALHDGPGRLTPQAY
ncbi:sigma factor-like helix-turn-helix DNA-binding protein [Streptomyces lusitanus]|uniref:Helix-turn-helix domain-containing protein n=1 Tax=Streptomyces lusitanus TaxID=68232 RepID=A0ABU3JSB7_9ACTN|nr:helix-turn-helix domain-containing protein [Streptomyces lusitanus]